MRSRLLPAALVVAFAWLGPAATAGPPAAPPPPDDARAAWAFTPPHRPLLPAVRHKERVANPIDAFVLARLEAAGLTLSDRADKLTLLRRVTFDLTGLPPTVAEQEAFEADPSPDAYARVVERLLASPRYGERWAQHWLDLVRYAETDGFKADVLRPEAHRYRDYVIRALNADLPYDRFVRQQLAGDELEPDNPDALVATGFNRLWPDEDNAANLEQRRQEILDDVTDVAGSVFLGLTVGCARCHDHKFDPILQTDYYRLQAFFAPMQPRDDLPAVGPAERQHHATEQAAWEADTRDVCAAMEALVAGKRDELRRETLKRFRAEIQQCVLTPEARRTPYQQQIAAMAEKQLRRAEDTAANQLPPEKKRRYQELQKRLAAAEPRPLPDAMAVTDVGREAPPTFRLAGGDWRKPAEPVQPGFPVFLGDAVPDTHLARPLASTGRRAALARWLTRADNPLVARVMVNRLWQHHFGAGIVATPSDFGSQGEPPTHPELLDYLAFEFVEHGWSLKHLHRLMVTSAAYCQASVLDPKQPEQARGLAVDREDKLLWHARRQRLEGEAIRDAMFALTGELGPRMFGRSARPPLPAGLSSYAWKPDATPAEQNRRSVYVLAKRNLRYPLFDAFDLPDQHNSCARRTRTTTAPQALALLNGDLALGRARRWAGTLLARFPADQRSLVTEAYRAAWGRRPSAEEVALGRKFLDAQAATLGQAGRGAARLSLPDPPPASCDRARAAAVVGFCHALLGSNEFLYVD